MYASGSLVHLVVGAYAETGWLEGNDAIRHHRALEIGGRVAIHGSESLNRVLVLVDRFDDQVFGLEPYVR